MGVCSLCSCRYFRTEESKESVLVIPVGSVTAKTELTYEYGARTKGKKPAVKTEEKGAYVSLSFVRRLASLASAVSGASRSFARCRSLTGLAYFIGSFCCLHFNEACT